MLNQVRVNINTVIIFFTFFVVSIDSLPAIYNYLFLILLWFIYTVFTNGHLNIEVVLNPFYILMLIANLIIAIKYTSVSENNIIAILVLYFLLPCVLVIVGYSVVTIRGKENYAYVIILAIVVGCVLHSGINILVNSGLNRWNLIDAFDASARVSATRLGSINTITFSSALFFIFSDSKAIKIIGAMSFVIAAAFSVQTGTRTQFVIIALLFVYYAIASLIRHIKVNRDSIVAIDRKVIIASPLVFAGIIWKAPVIIRKVEASNLGFRFIDTATAGSDNNRLIFFIDGLKNLITNPFGTTSFTNYFHNYWLDIGRVAGIVPVLLIGVYDVYLLWQLRQIYKNKLVDRSVKYGIICIIIGCFLNFLVEPILDGFFPLYYKFCILNGVVLALNRVHQNSYDND